jgi:hypothetical protein
VIKSVVVALYVLGGAATFDEPKAAVVAHAVTHATATDATMTHQRRRRALR